MRSPLIARQHLAMKLGIFIIGISSAYEVSWRQMGVQAALFLVLMLLEPRLYRKYLFALRKILVFITIYWVFATLFALDYVNSMVFSARILYLLLIMVSVWGSVDKRLVLWQLRPLSRTRLGYRILSYLLGTIYFLKAYMQAYHDLSAGDSIFETLSKAVDAGQRVHAQSPEIGSKVERDLANSEPCNVLCASANMLAAIFLFALVMVNSL